jgi:UDP-N-acetylglucosamine acyltransferase
MAIQPLIHPTAIIHQKAKIGEGVKIGPDSVVGEHVVLGDNVILHSHVVVEGRTSIGEGTQVFPFASLGHAPQDLKYAGEPSTLKIGKYNTIREHVTMNPGTEGDKMTTVVGDHCLFMVSSHVAHDCVVGDRVILANNATLAGHVEVGSFAIIGGLSAIHQFVRIGHHAMIGGMSGIESDIIPYGQATGDRATLVGLNLVGLKRRKFSREEITSLRSAYRLLFSSEGTLAERIDDVAVRFAENDVIQEIVQFIRGDSSRSICQPKRVA